MSARQVLSAGMLACVVIIPSTALGQAVGSDETPTTRLVVDPAATPRPSLRYLLLPGFAERKPGNAAPFYYRALLQLAHVESSLTREQIEFRDESRAVDVDQLPRQQVREFLQRYTNVFSEVARAAYREECDWDWGVREMTGEEFISLRLDEAQQTRAIARALALRARLEIAEGNYDAAIETLRLGYQMAHDVAKQQMLISSLVGMAIVGIMNQQLEALIAAPDSPNLYWALTTLPQPFIDVRDDMEREINVIPQMFPYLIDADTSDRSPEQWRSLLTKSMHAIMNGSYEVSQAQPDARSRWMTLAAVMQGYPAAKRALAERGYSPDDIEQMPVGKVIAVHVSQLNRYVSDELRKWTYLPYSEARQRIRQTETRLRAERVYGPLGNTLQTIPVTSHLFPAVGQALHAAVRRDLAFAAHRVIEAIRMQAAANQGKLPESLADVTIVPAPDNPLTGEPFPYQVDGTTAVLTLPTTLPGDPRFGRIYEITVRQAD